jgi:hydrophobe/amphiphile efflux-3 (HAE3) family protein
MSDAWQRVGVWLARHGGLAIGAVVAVALVAGIGLPRLDFATGQDSYLNADTDVYRNNAEYQDLFGGQAMVTLFSAEDEGTTVVDLFGPEKNATMLELEEEIRDIEGVDGVVSPVSAIMFTENLVTPTVAGDPTSSPAGQILLRTQARAAETGDTEDADARLADALTTLERLNAVPEDQRTLENPVWVEFLLTDNAGNIRAALRPFFTFAPGVEPTLANATHAQMVTRMSGNASLETEGSASVAVVDAVDSRDFPGFSTVTTGAPIILNDINDYLQGGMLTLGGIAVIVMLVILAVAFRVRWRLLALAATLIGIVWIFGLLGFIGFELSLVTIAGLPILIGMGIDFSIQVHSRVEEEITLGHDRSPFGETLRNLGTPLVVAAAAAVIAFLCMQISRVPMVRDFGTMLAIGIAILLVVGVTVTTGALGVRERRSPTPEAAERSGITERIVMVLGSLPRVAAVPLVVLAAGVFTFGIVAEDAFEIESDPEKWVDQNSAAIGDLEQLREETGSSSELGVYIQTDDGVLTDELGEFATRLALDEIEQDPERLLTASSIYTTTFYLADVPGTEPIMPTGDDLQAVFDAAPPDVQTSLVAQDATSANLIFRVGPSSLEDRKEVVDRLEATVEPPPGVLVTPSGLAVVGVGLLENVTANRTELTYVALAAVALFLALRYLSIVRALLALIPVVMAVGASSLIVAAAGFKLSPLTTISGPLVIATCTEFSSLILARYLEERKHKRLSPDDANAVAGARTGKAFVASGLTTIGGFFVLVFAELPLLRDFGIIVTLNIAVALLSALVVLPPLLRLADPWMKLPEPLDGPGTPVEAAAEPSGT